MLTAEAHVRTERPRRYLDQLGRHADHLTRLLRHRAHNGDDHAPPEVRHVEWSDTRGVVTLNWGTVTVQATHGALTLRAEAANGQDLRRIQDLLAARLEKIGRRDRLTVTWREPEAPTSRPANPEPAGDPHPDEAPRREQHTAGRRSRIARWSLVAVAVVLILAVHLGLGGAALAGSSWTIWTVAGLVTIVVLKIIGVRLLTRHRFGRRSRRSDR